MKRVILAGLIAAFVPCIVAAQPCDGFEVKLRNNLVDDLLITTVKLEGGKLNPSSMQKLDSQTEQVLTVNKSSAARPMKGEIVFHTISLPSRTIKIRFNLVNDSQACKHTDTSPASDYIISRSSQADKVSYSINYK